MLETVGTAYLLIGLVAALIIYAVLKGGSRKNCV